MVVLNILDQPAVSIPSGAWAVRGNRRRDITSLDYWTDLGRIAEESGFHSVFIADVLGVHDVHKGSSDDCIRYGEQFPALDPSIVATAILATTRRLGVAITASTTYSHPFDIARRLSTIDQLSAGRVAWNIVTSYLPNAARNFGAEELLAHDSRYDLADEYLDVAYALWERSWDDDAVRWDAETLEYADPAKVHRIDHAGPRFSVEGPHLVPPSPQRTPVIYQAGSSARGLEFAARHAECIFLSGMDRELFARKREQVRAFGREHGRDPGDYRFIVGLTAVVGDTREHAAEIVGELERVRVEDAVLATYSGYSGIDLSAKRRDAVLAEEHTEQGRTAALRYTAESSEQWEVRRVIDDLLKVGNNSVFVAGTAEDVADQIEEYIRDTGVDGFNLYPGEGHAGIERFGERVIPILERRGLFSRPAEPTLRQQIFGGGPVLNERHPARAARAGAGVTAR